MGKLELHGSELINNPLEFGPEARPILLVVLTPHGLDVRYDTKVSKAVLDDAAACVADAKLAGWHFV